MISFCSDSLRRSELGTFKVKGFEINLHGLKKTLGSGRNEQSHQHSFSGSSVESFNSFVRAPQELQKINEIGKGCCGNVVKAVHIPTMRLVAIKQISVFERDRRHQMVKELAVLAKHTDVKELISMQGAFYDEGCVSLILEYMNRQSLQEFVNAGVVISEHMLQHIALQAVRGLHEMHSRRYIHRDIKPGNILINHRGDVKLADFGVLAPLENMAFATTFVGTVMFMSPERVEGKYTFAADIWGLGMSLYVLATLLPPFDAKDGYFGIVRKIKENDPPRLPCVTDASLPVSTRAFSPALCDFVSACLVKDADRRPTAEALLTHPFLTNADIAWNSSPAQQAASLAPFAAVTSAQEQDLLSVLQVFLHHHYLQPAQQYRRSLFELSTLQRIAEEVGVPPQHVQAAFEHLYVQTLSSLSHSQIEPGPQQPSEDVDYETLEPFHEESTFVEVCDAEETLCAPSRSREQF